MALAAKRACVQHMVRGQCGARSTGAWTSCVRRHPRSSSGTGARGSNSQSQPLINLIAPSPPATPLHPADQACEAGAAGRAGPDPEEGVPRAPLQRRRLLHHAAGHQPRRHQVSLIVQLLLAFSAAICSCGCHRCLEARLLVCPLPCLSACLPAHVKRHSLILPAWLYFA